MTVALLNRRGWISRGWAVFLLGGVLLMSVGCSYNDHRVMGATEKWVASDIHTIPKAGGFLLLALGDAIVAPVSMWMDVDGNDWSATSPHHEDYKYFSYAASREIVRSDMGGAYQWVASLLSIPIETAYLVVTGPVDIVTILNDGDGWEW